MKSWFRLSQISPSQTSPLKIAVIASLVATCVTSAAIADHGEMPKSGAANELPAEVKNVGIDEHLGQNVDLDLKFRDEDGKLVALRDFAIDGKPILLSLAYYGCPSLCTLHLNALLDAFKQMKETVGDHFNFVVVSIEPSETPELAKAKKQSYIESYGRSGNGWHFLTGQQADIQLLAKQIGFKYHWDESAKQWAHASAAYFLTPKGKISRYLYGGVVFDPKTLRLSAIEASEGKVGTIVDRFVLFCFHFDPKASKYSLAAFNVMRGGGILIVIVLSLFMVPFWIRNRKNRNRIGQ